MKGVRPIAAVSTSTAGFVGAAPDSKARLNQAVPIKSWAEFINTLASVDDRSSTMLAQGVYGFFLNGGRRCHVVNVGPSQPIAGSSSGQAVLEAVDDVSIVAAPGYFDSASHLALIEHCDKTKDRVAILDPPRDVADLQQLTKLEGEP